MNFLEKDLEQIIYESSNFDLMERGLLVNGTPKRQLKIGNYGIADLVYFNRDYHLKEHYNFKKLVPYLHITILELKKDKIGISAFLQSIRYAKGIKTYIEKYNPGIRFKINIKLIGSQIDTSGSLSYLPDLFEDSDSYPINKIECIDFYSYSYNIDGIQFIDEFDYQLTHDGFLKVKK